MNHTPAARAWTRTNEPYWCPGSLPVRMNHTDGPPGR